MQLGEMCELPNLCSASNVPLTRPARPPSLRAPEGDYQKRNTLPSPPWERGRGVRGPLFWCIIWVIRLKEILLGGESFTASRFTRHVSRFSVVFVFRAVNISLLINSNETLASSSQTS